MDAITTRDTSTQKVGSLRRRLTRFAQQPLMAGTLLLIFVILLIFVVYPVFTILRESLIVEGRISLGNYVEFFTSTYFLHTLYNTLAISALSTVGAVLLGLIFAFAITRTAIPAKNFFMLVSILPLITPPFFTAFAFILLFGRQGLFNQLLYRLFEVRWLVYGWDGVTFALILTLYPIAFLNLVAALSSIDPRLEEAAEDMGAPFWQVMRRVTLPLLTPSLFSSSLLVFMFSLSAFGIPALLGSTGLFWSDTSMLAPEAFIQILGVFNWQIGTAIAVIMLVPSFLLYLLQGWYIRRRSYITITGIPTAFAVRPTPRSLSRLVFIICLITAAIVLSLYVVIFLGAFTRTWGVDYSFSTRHLELMFDRGIMSVRNSLLLSLGGGALASTLGVLIAFILNRWRFPGIRVMAFIALLPYALPGLAMGLGFAAGFNTGPIVLTGTWMIILLDYAFRRMPFGIESGSAAIKQVDITLEEAAADMGANWPVVLRRITLPLLRPTLVAAFAFSFIKAMTDITSVIFLVSPRWKLMSVDVYNYISAGRLGVAAAMSSVMVLVVLTVIAIVWKVSGLGYRMFKL